MIENQIDVQFSTGIPFLTFAVPQNVVLNVCVLSLCEPKKHTVLVFLVFFSYLN